MAKRLCAAGGRSATSRLILRRRARAQRHDQAIAIERLLEEVECAGSRRPHGLFDGGVAADDDDWRGGIGALDLAARQLLEQVEAVLLAELHVDEGSVDRLRTEHLDRLIEGGGLDALVPLTVEDQGERAADVLLVVDDEDGGGRHQKAR